MLYEAIDYADLCARLQQKLSLMEGHMAQRLADQQAAHERAMSLATEGGRRRRR